MKKFLFLVAIATTTTLLWANASYANLSSSSCTSDFNHQESPNYSETANSASCASSCYAVNSGNDCGNVVYEIDDFPGSAHHSTLGGNGSGTGCQYYGYTSPHILGAGSNSSYTLCTEYTASSVEASYITYLNAGSSSCINRSLSLYKSSTCSTPSAINLEQPTNTYPGRARGLTIGESYVVCHTYTENACSSDFSSGIFEVCMTISEAAYCSSSANPQPVETCSGEDFQITLANCTTDPDLGVAGGTPGYAALFYSTDGGNTFANFPANSTAEDISGNINYKFYDDSNFSNGGGCSPIDVRGIVNIGCEPLVIPIGIVSIDVASVSSPLLQILPDCPIVETTITVYPQFTSQVTGSTIQLIAENGTVCETYSNTGSDSGSNSGGLDGTITFPINLNTYIPRPVFGQVVINQSPTLGTFNWNDVSDINQPDNTLGGSSGSNNTGSGSGSGIPDGIPCITPSGAGDLAAVNNNGETLLAHTVDINEDGQLVFNYELPAQIQKAKLYPNPATNQLFFSTGIVDTYTVRIYDTLGKQVFTGQANDDIAINIQHLPSGLYTYALEDNQQDIFDHGKWVKQ